MRNGLYGYNKVFYLKSIHILLFMFFMMMVSNFNFIPSKAMVIAFTLVTLSILFLPYLPQVPYTLFRDVNIILFMLFYWSLYTSIWTEFPLEAMQRVFIVYVPTFFILVLVVVDDHKTKTFIAMSKLICFSVSIISSIALVLRFFGNTVYSNGRRIEELTVGPFNIFQELYGIPPFFRVTSITNNPNTLALWIAISMTLCFYLYWTKNISLKVFIFYLIVQVPTMILTLSRGGIVSAIISLSLIYMMSKKKRILYVLYLLLMLIAIFLFFFFEYSGSIFLWEYSELRISTNLNDRQDAWGPLVRYIMENPLLGSGFGVSSEAILQKQQVNIAAHNLYLMIFSEIGLLGGSLFLSFWFLSIIKAFALYRNAKKISLSEQEYYSILVSFSLQIALIFHQFFEANLMRLDFIHFVWIYLIAYTSELYKFKKVGVSSGKNKDD